MVTCPAVSFFTIFGSYLYFLRTRLQNPLRKLMQTHTHTDANRKGRQTHIKRVGKGRRVHIKRRKGHRAHTKHRKGPQGAYKAPKRAAGRSALPNKLRVSTIHVTVQSYKLTYFDHLLILRKVE